MKASTMKNNESVAMMPNHALKRDVANAAPLS